MDSCRLRPGLGCRVLRHLLSASRRTRFGRHCLARKSLCTQPVFPAYATLRQEPLDARIWPTLLPFGIVSSGLWLVDAVGRRFNAAVVLYVAGFGATGFGAGDVVVDFVRKSLCTQPVFPA